jgi:hypothetical protein
MRTAKEQKDRENAQILDLWLACYTEAEIGETLELPRQTVHERLQVLPESYRDKNSAKLAFQDDFPVPLYSRLKRVQEIVAQEITKYNAALTEYPNVN